MSAGTQSEVVIPVKEIANFIYILRNYQAFVCSFPLRALLYTLVPGVI